MQKGAMIGKGMTAEVYEYGQDKILKLYFDWFQEKWIKFEEEIGYAINKGGIPSPTVYGMVNEDERKGIIYQRIDGIAMLKLIEEKPWKLMHFAREMAKLHNNIHNCHIDKLPPQNKRLETAILESADIFGDKTEKIITYLSNLPESNRVCHGDFHPDNILVSAKEATVIDWFNAYSGNPLSDVARTCLIIRSPFMPQGTPAIIIKFSKIIKHMIYSVYLKEYIKLASVNVKDVNAWILPMAAARLRDKIPGEKKWLLDIIDRELD